MPGGYNNEPVRYIQLEFIRLEKEKEILKELEETVPGQILRGEPNPWTTIYGGKGYKDYMWGSAGSEELGKCRVTTDDTIVIGTNQKPTWKLQWSNR